MSRMIKLDQPNHIIRDEELRKCLGIESLSEILDRMRMNWLEKVAKIPATLDDNRLSRKLLGAWCIGCKRRQGGQLKLYAICFLICCVNLYHTHMYFKTISQNTYFCCKTNIQLQNWHFEMLLTIVIIGPTGTIPDVFFVSSSSWSSWFWSLKNIQLYIVYVEQLAFLVKW